MVKLQIFCRAALRTLAAVALPHLQLRGRWYHKASLRVSGNGDREILLPLDLDESEFEDLSSVALLPPGIHKVEYAVVRPYTLLDLFEYVDAFGRASFSFECLGGSMEFPILHHTLLAKAIPDTCSNCATARSRCLAAPPASQESRRAADHAKGNNPSHSRTVP
jgi:hypothetical protein